MSEPYERDGHPRQCSATTRSGMRCRSFAIVGAPTCRMHGSSAPQVRAAADRRQAEADAAALVGKIWRKDVPPVVNPVDALQQLAGRLQHAADVLGERLDEHGLEGGAATVWTRVLRELRQALEAMERLDLANKALALAQQQADVVVAAFLAALDVAGLAPAERTRVVSRWMAGIDPVVSADSEGRVAVVISEATGESLARGVRSLLAQLALTQEQEEIAGRALPAVLRELGHDVVRGELE